MCVLLLIGIEMKQEWLVGIIGWWFVEKVQNGVMNLVMWKWILFGVFVLWIVVVCRLQGVLLILQLGVLIRNCLGLFVQFWCSQFRWIEFSVFLKFCSQLYLIVMCDYQWFFNGMFMKGSGGSLGGLFWLRKVQSNLLFLCMR